MMLLDNNKCRMDTFVSLSFYDFYKKKKKHHIFDDNNDGNHYYNSPTTSTMFEKRHGSLSFVCLLVSLSLSTDNDDDNKDFQ